jgi:hypothetical protein
VAAFLIDRGADKVEFICDVVGGLMQVQGVIAYRERFDDWYAVTCSGLRFAIGQVKGG